MFQTKVVVKLKTHILCSITLSRISCRLRDSVEKLRTARQATNDTNADDSNMLRIRFACWVTKTTGTYLEYVILVAFLQQNLLRQRTPMLHLYVYSLC